jgi:hypothetical protein
MNLTHNFPGAAHRSVGGDALRVDNYGSEENQRTSSPIIINHVNQKIESIAS